jgi:hypothetical protein
MTVSAIEAELLDQALSRAQRQGVLEEGFGGHWFRSIARTVDAAWDGVSIEDFRFPELADRRPFRLRPLQWYMGRVNRATYRSPAVTEQFYRVVSFIDPPSTLFHPRIAAQALAGGFRTGLGKA